MSSRMDRPVVLQTPSSFDSNGRQRERWFDPALTLLPWPATQKIYGHPTHSPSRPHRSREEDQRFHTKIFSFGELTRFVYVALGVWRGVEQGGRFSEEVGSSDMEVLWPVYEGGSSKVWFGTSLLVCTSVSFMSICFFCLFILGSVPCMRMLT